MPTTKKKRGPKGKYAPELVSRMLQIIEQTGQDKPAYESVGVTAETFYKWMREKPELSGSVARAREAFYSRDDEEIINRCREALIRHLGIHEENWTSEETTTLPDGSTVVKKSDRSVMRPPSEWAVKLVTPMLSGGLAGVQRAEITQDVTITDGNAREENFGNLFAELDAYRTGVNDGNGESDPGQPVDSSSADNKATKVPRSTT